MTKFDYKSGDPLDASLGLIMRLNKLWFEVDDCASSGDYQRWNIKLDCIFRNLLYKEYLDIEIDEDGKVTGCKLSIRDQNLYNYLNKEVKIASREFKNIKSKAHYEQSKENLYNALQIKDIGLRKFMFQLKLYLKQGDRNPANAMWGG
jgi:hypothetical protein